MCKPEESFWHWESSNSLQRLLVHSEHKYLQMGGPSAYSDTYKTMSSVVPIRVPSCPTQLPKYLFVFISPL